MYLYISFCWHDWNVCARTLAENHRVEGLQGDFLATVHAGRILLHPGYVLQQLSSLLHQLSYSGWSLYIPEPGLPIDSRLPKIVPVSLDLAFANIRQHISCTKSTSSLSGRVWVFTFAFFCHRRVLFHAHVAFSDGNLIVFVKLCLGLSISAVVLVLVLRTYFQVIVKSCKMIPVMAVSVLWRKKK